MINFGQGTITLKSKESIIIINYIEEKIGFLKRIKHRALNIAEECHLISMMSPIDSKFIILFYMLNGALAIIVWDIENDIEHSNFFGRKEDNFSDYITGAKSKLGYACFDKYIVNLDNCIPIPFISKQQSIDPTLWGQGTRINKNEEVILSLGTINTSICYKDIVYSCNSDFKLLDIQKVVSKVFNN